MLEWLIPHIQIYLIVHTATLLIFLFGSTIAAVMYWFVLIHIRAYEIAKDVYNGIFPRNA